MPNQTFPAVYDVTVIGGGLAGNAASVALPRGVTVFCIEPRRP